MFPHVRIVAPQCAQEVGRHPPQPARRRLHNPADIALAFAQDVLVTEDAPAAAESPSASWSSLSWSTNRPRPICARSAIDRHRAKRRAAQRGLCRAAGARPMTAPDEESSNYSSRDCAVRSRLRRPKRGLPPRAKSQFKQAARVPPHPRAEQRLGRRARIWRDRRSRGAAGGL